MRRPSLTIWLAAAVAAATMACGGSALAQGFPNKPIKVIVPYSPGGSTDLAGRTLGKVAEKYLGQPLVIENKPGAGSMLGYNALVEAKPDGYTLAITNTSLVTQSLYGNNKYDYPTAIDALAQLGEIPFVLAVRADAPWKTLKEFVDHAKANPKKVKYGITGYGNTAHLASEALKLEAKIEMEAVNFDGGAPLLAALLGGHIDAASNNPVDLREHLKAGKMRVLVVYGEQRLADDPLLKDVPTAKEQGYDIIAMLWNGVGGPKNLPADVKAKLAEGLRGIIQDPETQNAVKGLGLNPVYKGPEEFGKMWLAEQARTKKLVMDSGIYAIIKSQTK